MKGKRGAGRAWITGLGGCLGAIAGALLGAWALLALGGTDTALSALPWALAPVALGGLSLLFARLRRRAPSAVVLLLLLAPSWVGASLWIAWQLHTASLAVLLEAEAPLAAIYGIVRRGAAPRVLSLSAASVAAAALLALRLWTGGRVASRSPADLRLRRLWAGLAALGGLVVLVLVFSKATLVPRATYAPLALVAALSWGSQGLLPLTGLPRCRRWEALLVSALALAGAYWASATAIDLVLQLPAGGLADSAHQLVAQRFAGANWTLERLALVSGSGLAVLGLAALLWPGAQGARVSKRSSRRGVSTLARALLVVLLLALTGLTVWAERDLFLNAATLTREVRDQPDHAAP